MISCKPGAPAKPKVTSTKLGLQRLAVVGKDSYEQGTEAPRACNRLLDADAIDVDPTVEDAHDAALAAAEAAAREEQDDAAAL